jgi:hypothetical protein
VTWSKLDDGFWMHPKVVRAGNTGAGLYARMLSYCGCYLSDGEIPPPIVESVVGRDKAALKRLIESALVERRDDGTIVIPDYLDFNPSREEIHAKRRKDSERKTRGRREESERTPDGIVAESAGSPSALAGGGPRALPVPSRPVPKSPPGPPPAGGRKRDRERWENAALGWVASLGLAGRRESLLRAVTQAEPWMSNGSAAQDFEKFVGLHFSRSITRRP